MTTLAVDPGAVNIGWSVLGTIENQLDRTTRRVVLECGLFSPAKKKEHVRFSTGLNYAMIQMWPFFDNLQYKYQVTEMIWEIVPVKRMGQRDRILATTSVLKCIAIHRGIPWAEVPSTSAKKRFTGNGKASKEETRQKVHELFPDFPMVDGMPPDVYDSIQVGVAGPNNGWWGIHDD